MIESTVIPIHSSEFDELKDLFYTLEQPYGLKEIYRFNHTYERIYRNLRREEKRRAEMFVDALIEGIKTPDLACKIFGVV